MGTESRRGTIDDAPQCGAICFKAFKRLADRHGFEPDFPSAEMASGLFATCFVHPGFYGVVDTRDESIIGSNFLDERSQIRGIGPVCAAQSPGVGRLMQHVLDRVALHGAPWVRLVQHGHNNQSLRLYTSLGFASRCPSWIAGANSPARS